MKCKNVMARALYDNVPETPEELSFRKGDILTVIEQNAGGIEGWWLCSLHGRQGIAPGNRLKLLIGPVFDSPPSQQLSHSDSLHQSFQQQQLYQIPASQMNYRSPVYQVPPTHLSQGIYQVPTGHGQHVPDVHQALSSPQKNMWGLPDGAQRLTKVVTPTRVGQTYVYDSSYKLPMDTYDIPPFHPQGVYDVPPTSVKGLKGEPRPHGIYDIPPSQGVYSIPPVRDKMYDFPPSRCEGVYDVPPPSTTKAAYPDMSCQAIYNFPTSSEFASQRQGIYDVPPAHQILPLANHPSFSMDAYDFPRGNHITGQHSSISGRRGTEEQDGVYDIPPQVSHDPKRQQDVTDGINRLSISSTSSTRSNMSTSSSSSKESFPACQDRRLLLDLDRAIEKNSLLQQAEEVSISELLVFVKPDWRSKNFMEKHINEIHATVDKVRQSLAEFLDFSKGAVANASYLPDLTLHNKMKKQLQRLSDSYQILAQTSQALDTCSWSLNVLVVNKPQSKCDDLDRFVMVAKTVLDDAKGLASSISANAELLFQRGSCMSHLERTTGNSNTDKLIYNSPPFQTIREERTPVQTTPVSSLANTITIPNFNISDSSGKSWMEDYDYVHLQGKEEFEKQQKELLEKENITKQSKLELEQHQLKQFQQLEKEIITPVENDISKWNSPPSSLPSNTSLDKQLLMFYSEQCENHFVSLLNSIDAFFNCITTSQPPRIFVAHSKFIILSAHKLVFIGDTLARQAATQDVRNKAGNCSNQLCELLRTIVSATKMAALHYPNTAALQEMVDRVTELSSQTQLFKLTLQKMALL
ncbi:enhancer of filamentation 1 [Protopterus annectens]|uniref:enhancer of filamentation 1 n=1 Tax=Protopterus annectens TaxID=7888 RepID=UPI001CFC086B|nr:enhancer of filamentation 1 [Protopterus annectens]